MACHVQDWQLDLIRQFNKGSPMRTTLKFAALLLMPTFSTSSWACNPTEAQEGINWCKLQCGVPHSNAQCDASGRMATYARFGDALGIRNAFGDCQTGNDQDKWKQRVNVESCFNTNKKALIDAACNVYGCPAPQPPVPPPVINPVDAPASINTYDGNDMIVARRGVSFLVPLAYDYRVCNTEPTAALNIDWTDKDNNPTAQPPHQPFQQRLLPAGFCIEFGNATSPQRVTSIRLAATTGAHQTGSFSRYPLGTFADIVHVDNAPPAGSSPSPAHPADATKVFAQCSTVTGSGSSKPGDTIFVKQCPIPIPTRGNYRICFDAKYVELSGGGISEWPPTRLPIVLDKSLVSIPSPSNSEDPRRNWIFGNNCRDYYDVQSAYVIVGKTIGDANFAPGGTWDPNKVLKVYMWIATLK
jgi:hypothetical protein